MLNVKLKRQNREGERERERGYIGAIQLIGFPERESCKDGDNQWSNQKTIS